MKTVDEKGRPIFLMGGVWYVVEDGRPVVHRITPGALDRLEEEERGHA